jgi:hypothetical protein
MTDPTLNRAAGRANDKCVERLNAAGIGSAAGAFIHTPRRNVMVDHSNIKEHAEIIGADGVHVGTVDRVEGERIKLTKKDSGEGRHKGHHHYIPLALVAEVDGDKVRLSADADVAVDLFEEEAGGESRG